MAKIRSYTTVEQSRVLAEILPPDSADMCYIQDLLAGCKYGEYRPYIGNIIPAYGQDKIKCWSLSALLDIIPKHIKDYNVLRVDISENDFAIWYDEIGFGVNNDLPDITADNPVDACYEFVLKLNELNLL